MMGTGHVGGPVSLPSLPWRQSDGSSILRDVGSGRSGRRSQPPGSPVRSAKDVRGFLGHEAEYRAALSSWSRIPL